MNKSALAYELYKIQAIKLGSFVLKSGQISPIYIDLRPIISYPHLLRAVAKHLWAQVANYSFDLLCGVPYTALPIATCIALEHDKPMVIRRKEAKKYGTGKLIEGAFQSGNSCLIVEDIVTTGSSIIETLYDLNSVGLTTPIAVTFLDRQQGGVAALKGKSCQLLSVFTLSSLLTELNACHQLSAAEITALNIAIASCQTNT